MQPFCLFGFRGKGSNLGKDSVLYSTGDMWNPQSCEYTQKRSGESSNTLWLQRRTRGWKRERETKNRKGNRRNSTEDQTDECMEAMLRGLYLRLGLLGGRRCGDCCWCNCCGASPVVMAEPLPLPAPPSWWCCRAALLLEREAPCERECCWPCPWLWPSDGEGFDVPGLLWDFSIVGTCVSKTTRFTKLLKES